MKNNQEITKGSLQEAKSFFESNDNFRILAHKSPDGDTLGSSFALFYALKKLGKKAFVCCADEFPGKFSYFYPEKMEDIKFDKTVSVDVADRKLLGDKFKDEKIDFCIDHHIGNKIEATFYCIDDKSAACAEVVFSILKAMDVEIDKVMAECLYTGICTDTGCFMFSNTSPKTHRIAAELMEFGARAEKINREMFGQKTKARLLLEKSVLENMEFLFEGRCTYVLVTKKMMEESGAEESTFDGIPAIPRCPVGVQIGITVREKEKDEYKVSTRTSEEVDANEFCKNFGGGGHIRAGGFKICGSQDEVYKKIIDLAKRVVK